MKLLIDGRRWYDSTWGNTYHTIQIIADKRVVHTSEITYGYEKQYQQTAMKWLQDNNYNLEELVIEFTVLDVNRDQLHKRKDYVYPY